MLDSLKASFWPMSQPANHEQSPQQQDASDHLSELMGQLDAGIAQSMAREGAKLKAASGALQRENDPRPPAAEAVSQVDDDAAVDEAVNEALRVVADQRKAAEALLYEACALEDRLKDEVQIAQAVRASTAAKEECDRATADAEEAMVAALQKFDARNALQAEREQLEQLLAAKRTEADAAKAKIDELVRALEQAKESAEQIYSAVALHEARAKECADKERAAQTEETHAVERMQECNASRDAAKAAAASARERVEALKQTASSHRTNGLEASQALAARIAEQFKLLKQQRESLSDYTAA